MPSKTLPSGSETNGSTHRSSAPAARRSRARSKSAEPGDALSAANPNPGKPNRDANARGSEPTDRPDPGLSGTMRNALGTQVPVREWDHLSAASRAEIEHMVEVLKAMKQGDFTVRFEYEKHGVLSRAGELLNDVIGLNDYISLTAKAMQGDREKALEAGASGYVTKPVDPGKLLSVIHRWRQRSTPPEAVGGS